MQLVLTGPDCHTLRRFVTTDFSLVGGTLDVSPFKGPPVLGMSSRASPRACFSEPQVLAMSPCSEIAPEQTGGGVTGT